jgi:ClpP class serine protease
MNDFEKLKEEIAAAQSAIFNPINDLITAAEDDATKYYDKGVKSAGNRLKKTMQEIRKAIKHPAVKAEMTKVQEGAKALRQTLVDASK